MEFKEIYCFSCKKSLGRYCEKYFSDQKMGEIIKVKHSSHVHEGHEIVIKASIDLSPCSGQKIWYAFEYNSMIRQ